MKFLHLSVLHITLIGCLEIRSADDSSQSEDSFGSGDIDFTECDGESCDLSVKFPTLAIRLPSTKLVEKELSQLRKRFELFRRGAAEERKVWRTESENLREKIVALEDAIHLNIRKTENVTNHVTEEFKQNIEVNSENMRHMFDVDFKNIVHQFKSNLSDEVASTMTEYANNTFAISAAIEKMQMKIDSASDEIEKQLEEFEASIDAKSQELEENLQEQCKKYQEKNKDEPSVGPEEMKTNPEDKLLISDKGVTIMKCYQCCEEVELTNQILDRISGGMFSKMNKQIKSDSNNDVTQTVTTTPPMTTTPTMSTTTATSTTTMTSTTTSFIATDPDSKTFNQNDDADSTQAPMTIESLDLTPSPQSEITTSADELTSVTSMTSKSTPTVATSALDFNMTTLPPNEMNNMTTYKTKTMSPAKDTEALLRPIKSPESMKIQNSTQSDPDCLKCAEHCAELYQRGFTTSGVYRIAPSPKVWFEVWCDQETDGGGWTVIQRRLNGEVSFDRDWKTYKDGFGNIRGDYWVGLQNMYLMTKQVRATLRIDLVDWTDEHRFAQYERVKIGHEKRWYKLNTWGDFTGDAGDALQYNQQYNHNTQMFTTLDQDHDNYANGNCASYYKSGWWFDACFAANLNGKYYHGSYDGQLIRDGIYWGKWSPLRDEKFNHMSFQYADMKIRPRDFLIMIDSGSEDSSTSQAADDAKN